MFKCFTSCYLMNVGLYICKPSRSTQNTLCSQRGFSQLHASKHPAPGTYEGPGGIFARLGVRCHPEHAIAPERLKAQGRATRLPCSERHGTSSAGSWESSSCPPRTFGCGAGHMLQFAAWGSRYQEFTVFNINYLITFRISCWIMKEERSAANLYFQCHNFSGKATKALLPTSTGAAR